MNRHTMMGIAISIFSAFAVAGCTADAGGGENAQSTGEALTIQVTAKDIAKLRGGEKYALDIGAHRYQVDPKDGAVDTSKIVLDGDDAPSLDRLLASATAKAGTTAEAFTKKPFVVEEVKEEPEASAPGVATTAGGWNSIEVWIAPEGPDDVFRIGHVWIWRKRC